MARRRLFTSESVTEGHPDKVCDAISDGVLDEALRQDPNARVACETLAAKNTVFVAGEITAEGRIDYDRIARSTLRSIGYLRAEDGMSADTCAILTSVSKQSPDIARGVGADEGAGDQGLMFGFAVAETRELMPAPIMLAHRLARRLAQVRKDRRLPYLRPDGKTQVTVTYEDERVVDIPAIVVAAQHAPEATREQIERDVREHVVAEVVPERWIGPKTKYFVNYTGLFIEGGPQADTGVTGRKIIVDTYGGRAPHGGGAFSGKDPSKVDRSANYMARYAAKNVVAAGLAHSCLIQVAYSIGSREPVSLHVDTAGTGVLDEDRIEALVRTHFDFTPKGMIKTLDLRRPIYQPTAAYGHFGRDDLDLPWERTDLAGDLEKAAGGKARPPALEELA